MSIHEVEPDTAPDQIDTWIRQRLAARQHEVLSALLAGQVPPGFEPRTTIVTGLVLRRKRWRAVLSTFPLLDRQAGSKDLFEQYAHEQRLRGCAHTDVTGFLSWAGHQSWPPAADLRRYWEVEQGRRVIALSRIGDQRLLVVGIGSWLYELPVRGWFQ